MSSPHVAKHHKERCETLQSLLFHSGFNRKRAEIGSGSTVSNTELSVLRGSLSSGERSQWVPFSLLLVCQSELTEFLAELTEFAAKLNAFSLPKQHSRNSIPPIPYSNLPALNNKEGKYCRVKIALAAARDLMYLDRTTPCDLQLRSTIPGRWSAAIPRFLKPTQTSENRQNIGCDWPRWEGRVSMFRYWEFRCKPVSCADLYCRNSVVIVRVNGVNVWMSEAFARDCQVNMWMDKTSLLSIPNMTGRPGYWTMEMNGGSSAP